MSTIDWATGLSGTWTTASNWSGDAVPGLSDTAVIDAASSHHYTVTINSPVAVGGVVLDQTNAVLAVDSSLTSAAIDLEAGTLALLGATIAGTITETGGKITLGKGDSVLSNVTLAGDVNVDLAKRSGTLTIGQSLKLTGANGSGPGTATFNCEVVLNGLSTLDGGTITQTSTSGLLLGEKTTLTLGSHLNLTARDILLKSGQSITNDGTLSAAYLSGGTLTNNGTINENVNPNVPDNFLGASSFTNNGLMNVNSYLFLNYQGLAAGPDASIVIDGGSLVLDGTLTTAQLLATFAAQHVTATGAYGFGVIGALDNSGATLQVGTGTTLGTLANGDINGGTIVDHGGDSVSGDLVSLAYQSLNSSLTLNYATLTSVDLTGVTSLVANSQVTLQNDTLSGVGTISADALNLDGTTITGAGRSGQVLITMQSLANAYVSVTANQFVAGYTVDYSADSQGFEVASGAALDNATLNFGAAGTNGDAILYGYGGSAGVSLGAHFTVNVAAGGYLILNGGSDQFPPAAILTSAGTMTIAGTLSVGSPYVIANFDNTGVIDIASGGTFVGGTNANDILSNGGLIAAINATLALASVTNTGEISAAFTAAAGTASIGGPLTGSGTVALIGAGTLALGGTVAVGQLVSLGSGTERLLFASKTADTGFKGTIGGFAAGDSITFTGENLSGASFAGTSIVATLSTGGTIALATTSALSGGLSVSESKGNATITYTGAEASFHGWTGEFGPASTLLPRGEAVAGGHAGAPWQAEKSWPWMTGHHVF